jgi:hypothetical protein
MPEACHSERSALARSEESTQPNAISTFEENGLKL